MRPLLALIVIFTVQLSAEAQESVDSATSQAVPAQWGKDRDAFVQGSRDEAKVKAFVRDLLGEDRPAGAIPVQETSHSSESVE